MTSPDPAYDFTNRTREVVEAFLQSVVVVDDLAEITPPGGRPASDVLSGPVEGPQYLPAPDPAHAEVGRDPTRVPLNAKTVIDGFADIGSVCAVLSPVLDRESRKRTVKAARRADIVVLDWNIENSVGDEALDLMRDILKGDREGRRLRLMAIYTGEPDLEGICERVRQVLAEFYKDDRLKDSPGGFRMSKGPLHVKVLAKSGTLAGVPSPLGDQEVSESGLADRLAGEFALMIGGLLRNVALSGLSAVRDNAHRVLAKFDASLDPGYLGHRLLLHHPPDAEDHIEEALGSEITAVLEEHRSGARADIDAIEPWLACREAEGLQLSEPFGPPSNQSAVKGWRLLLDRGFEAPNVPDPQFASKRKLRSRPTEPFAESGRAAARANRRFAALLALRTRYPGRPPRLSFGTVLETRHGDETLYFLCLQPKCDSVRLGDASGFPLMPLIPLTDVRVGGDGERLRLVVETEDDQWQELGIETKPSALTVRLFEPGQDPPGEVTAMADEHEDFFFEDSEGSLYRWIAQVKEGHALGVAGEIAAALARPGPNDAEWLRRASGARTTTR